MTAIITPEIRHDNAAALMTSFAGNQYYMGVGRGESWADDTAPGVPNEGGTMLLDARYGTQGMIKLSDASLVVPRWNWTYDEVYYSYDDRDTNLLSRPFYVMNDDYYVYICLVAGTGTSTIKPTGTTTSAFTTSDGYQWKFLYEVTTDGFNKFLTNVYMPIQKAPVADDTSLQWDVQNTVVAGAIHNIKVDTAGTLYTVATPPTVTITGNGTGATATAAVTGTGVTSITMTAIGSGYTYADITITDSGSGTGSVARAIISPAGGHGADVVKALGAYFVLINGRINDSVALGDIIPGQDFRQTSIFRNPLNFGTAVISTALSLSGNSGFTLTSDSGFALDDVITGGTSGAKAIVDIYDSSNNTLRYHQSVITGHKAFTVGETITSTAGTGVINTITDPEVDVTTGELVYIENHAPILHSAGVIEDMKLVIQF